MKINKNKLIVAAAVLLLIGIVFGFCVCKFHFNKPRDFGREGMPQFPQNGAMGNPQEMKLNETQVSETKSFFGATTDLEKLKDYCSKNMANCIYYCREIDKSNQVCSQLQPQNEPPKE